MFMFIRLIGPLLFLITSCTTISTQKTVKPYSSWEKYKQEALTHSDQFQLAGKIAFKTSENAGSATLNWKEKAGQYTITLFGPLGSYNLQLIGNKNHVSLKTSDGKIISARSPEVLLSSQLGYQLPISNLKYWIQGLAVPKVPAKLSLNSNKRLSTLSQSGWQVTYLDYRNGGLPNKISLTSGTLSLKIIIYHW